MKHHHGNTTYTVILFLILAAVGGAGWYFYSDEIIKNQSLVTDLRSEQTKLIKKQDELGAFLETISAEKLTLEASLRRAENKGLSTTAGLEAELEKQQAVQNSLRDTITTFDDERSQLLVQLEEQQKSQAELTALQKSLRDTITTVHDEKSQLLIQLQAQQKSQAELAALLEQTQAEKQALEAKRQQEISKVLLTTAELEAELKRRQSEQESLHDEIATVSSEKSQLLAQLEQEQQSKKQIANLKSRLEQELNESRVEISQLKDQMTVIKLTSEVLFNSGSATIKPAGEKVLSIIAESLNVYPSRAISIEGHTDNRALKRNNRYASNWELSAARSLAAVYHLQQNNQVDPKRLKVVGYGEFRPVANNETAEGRALNRRIEIRLLPPS